MVPRRVNLPPTVEIDDECFIPGKDLRDDPSKDFVWREHKIHGVQWYFALIWKF